MGNAADKPCTGSGSPGDGPYLAITNLSIVDKIVALAAWKTAYLAGQRSRDREVEDLKRMVYEAHRYESLYKGMCCSDTLYGRRSLRDDACQVCREHLTAGEAP